MIEFFKNPGIPSAIATSSFKTIHNTIIRNIENNWKTPEARYKRLEFFSFFFFLSPLRGNRLRSRGRRRRRGQSPGSDSRTGSPRRWVGWPRISDSLRAQSLGIHWRCWSCRKRRRGRRKSRLHKDQKFAHRCLTTLCGCPPPQQTNGCCTARLKASPCCNSAADRTRKSSSYSTTLLQKIYIKNLNKKFEQEVEGGKTILHLDCLWVVGGSWRWWTRREREMPKRHGFCLER